MGRERIPGRTSNSEAGESICQALTRLGLTRDETRKIFSTGTRDIDNLPVYRDEISGVIFIDGHYVGTEAYESGEYRQTSKPNIARHEPDFEDIQDTRRRFERYKQFFVGKAVCDFGCGPGSFLRLAKSLAKSVVGVELQKDFAQALNADDVPCVEAIEQVSEPLDTIFLFHTFEHLPNPSQMLRAIKSKLRPNGAGRIVIEVPHAMDFLISNMACREFVEFTLWSQHLILHTRNSLNAFLHEAGFRMISIEGVQRYGIANHFHWLQQKRPGGHKANLSILETDSLRASYADALSRLDANDTLVAVAST